MQENISLTYNPKKEYSETGYHTTLDIYEKSIIRTGFLPSKDNDDWLGEGVYFWDNIGAAKWWKGKGGIIKKCIFVCELKCLLSQYLDLDNPDEMNKFEIFAQKYVREMEKMSKLKPDFKNNNQRKKFFCDIYCSKNSFDILSFTFEHDIINKAGFKVGVIKRRQICVRNIDCITIISVTR